MSSRRKQMNPRSMKPVSPVPQLTSRSTRSSAAKLASSSKDSDEFVDENRQEGLFEGDCDDDEDDVDVDGEEEQEGSSAGGNNNDYDKKNTETPTSTSYNDAEEAPLSDAGDDDVGVLDMTGDDVDMSETADPLGGLLSYEKSGSKSGNGTPANGSANGNGNSSSDSSPFECHICHRKFKHRRSKSRHVMYHTGQKRHFCRYCNASFYRSDHLKAHTRTHTMPGILDVATNNDRHRQQPQQPQQLASRIVPSKSGRQQVIAIKRPSFDLESTRSMKEETGDGDHDLVPPMKMHKTVVDESSVAIDASTGGRRSVSSEQNSNFADAFLMAENNNNNNNNDGRHSMSTPLFYSSSHQQENEQLNEVLGSSNGRSLNNNNNNNNNGTHRSGNDFGGAASDSNGGETTGHRRCPFCQSSFATADQLRRHLREENCTLHHDSGMQHQDVGPLHSLQSSSTLRSSSSSKHQLQDQQQPPTAFAVPEPVTSSRSSGQLMSCPLCPTGQQQQFSQPAMLIMHLAYEHRFTQENLIAAVQQQQQQQNRAETPGSGANNANSNGSKSSESGLPSFVCQCCDLSTANLAKFHQHMFSAHLKFFYRCSLCSFSAPESEALAKHFLGSHCKVVVNSPLSAAQLQQQAGSHHQSGAIDYSSPSGKQLTGKASSNNGARPLVCSICSMACASRELFLAHMVTGHSWVRCSSCPEVFTSERALTKHIDSEHRTGRNSANSLAQQANASTTYLQTLLQNNKTSSSSSSAAAAAAHHHPPYHGDSVIQCLACSRTFRGRLAMKQHLIQFHHFDHVSKSFMFAEELYFVCDICPDVFRTANVLAEHNLAAHPQLASSSSSSTAARRQSNGVSSSGAQAAVSNNTLLSCNFCCEAFGVAIDLEKHMVEKHPEDLLKSTSKVVSAVVQQHASNSTASKVVLPPKKPAQPSSVSSNASSNGKQQSSSKQTGSIRCEQCSSLFESQYVLEMHMFDQHLMAFAKTTSAPSGDGEESNTRPSSRLVELMDVDDKQAVSSETPSPSTASGSGSSVPKRFQCSVCDKIFADLSSLAQHRIREHPASIAHSGSTSLRCSLCRVSVTSIGDYLKHADSHHKGSTNLNRTYYACCLCNEYLRDVTELTNHAAKAHFPESLTCVVCDTPLTDVMSARSIRLSGSNDLVYCCSDCYEVDADLRRCNLCNAVFDTLDNLRWHNTKYHADAQNGDHTKKANGTTNKTVPKQASNAPAPALKERKVAITGSTLASNSLKTKNDQNSATQSNDTASYVLPMPVNLQCSLCDTLCKSEEALTLHLIEHSYPDGNYLCPVCVDEEDGQLFDSAAALDEHVRAVHGTNSVGSSTCLCTECNRAFLWPAELNHHVAQHDLEREEHASQPVPGAAQTKAATAALQTAVANLAAPQSYSCNVCQRSFPTVRSLANHQRQCLSRNRLLAAANSDLATARNGAQQRQASGDKNGSECGAGDDAADLDERSTTLADPSEFLRCFICKNKFANAQSLQKHARSIHGVESAEFWCSLCDSKLVNYKQLLHHLSSEHDINIAQSVCELCGDSFTMLKNLKRHLKRVHGTIWQGTASNVSASCAAQHLAAVNSALTAVDSPSLGTSEESPEDGMITVVDD